MLPAADDSNYSLNSLYVLCLINVLRDLKKTWLYFIKLLKDKLWGILLTDKFLSAEQQKNVRKTQCIALNEK